ncbi:SDR family oxidoreductase [Flavobacterium sp. CBA20B-1]|uniref:SDR family oxidoreductase n=1 Tax=Paenimyroides aestuarii TaxID=2968490 RepID=A0ABY5NT66_9FLAO|nr:MULTISPECIES: SDR family oxidoreductase [Flavobacteriaceae]UUV21775.1 SDR family oxidoreductase [Paenimyroides aestuarii]WCM41694.1 SDR family oxidoreductase [Flavobacterium sp. CBA20B-1]
MKKEENKLRSFPKPPFDEPRQNAPASEQDMELKPDHGEQSYEGYNRMQDKCVVITGGDSGIGKATAIAFAREGADVVISYLSDMEDEDAKDTAEWIRKAGRKALLFKGDITKKEICQMLVEVTIKEFKKIDVLINNAAFQMGRETIDAISTEEWQLTFNTNVLAMFHLCQLSIPHMPKGSSIINTTSVNAYQPNPTLLPYAATKAAIQNYTANLNQMLIEQKKDIRVNAVAPGPVWTPLIPSTLIDYKDFGDDTALKRPGQPSEIAPIYVFLATKEASYIGGATIPATGGKIAY